MIWRTHTSDVIGAKDNDTKYFGEGGASVRVSDSGFKPNAELT